jgi:hypothetical protein
VAETAEGLKKVELVGMVIVVIEDRIAETVCP